MKEKIQARWSASLSEKWGLCKALLVAAAYSNVFTKAAWLRIWRAVTLWFELLTTWGEQVSDVERARRLHICESCPLYYAPLKTCGSPFLKQDADLGCWCFLPSKSRYVASQCWLDVELGENAPHGWIANPSSQN